MTSPPKPGIRMTKPEKSARVLISRLNQPPICTPVLPTGKARRLKGA